MDDDPVKLAAKEDYKSYLKQQIDERAKIREAQKEKDRLEDEREVGTFFGIFLCINQSNLV